VAGAPHVTNRTSLLAALQVMEASSIIGLIRRTQALAGRVGVVAGVLGLFRRDAVLAVGGSDSRMATEDIDLTWRLLLAGWQTTYEPRALVGMQVPATPKALWAQRKRWARGQGEVLNVHRAEVMRWRNRRMWLLSVEAVASLLWVTLLAAALIVTVLQLVIYGAFGAFGFGLAWGIAISVVATVQLGIALLLDYRYDPRGLRAFLLGPIYPIAFWLFSALAALHSEIGAFIHGPRDERVVWDIPREAVEKKSG
jgi:biofilm PGA synthesis N-glycosyltransferase PgaC